MKFPTPQARFEERIELALNYPTILIVAWPDRSQRNAAVRASAATHNAMLMDCEGMRSRSFLKALAVRLGIDGQRSTLDIYLSVYKTLKESRRPLFLDNAECFDQRVLGMLRDFYDEAKISIVVAASTARLIGLTDDRETGAQLFSRTCLCDLRD